MSGLKFIKGESVDLQAEIQKGTVVLLEIWATWCPPCRTSIPHVTSIQQNYKDLLVIGVTREDEAKAGPFVVSMGATMDYRVAIDADQSIYRDYMQKHSVGSIPHAFLISEGEVKWHGHPMDPTIEQQIQSSLNKNA